MKPKLTKPNNSWEKEFDRKFRNWFEDYQNENLDENGRKRLIYFITKTLQQQREEAVFEWFKEVKPIILIKDKDTHKTIDMLDLIYFKDRITCLHNGKFEYKSVNGKERVNHIKTLQSLKQDNK